MSYFPSPPLQTFPKMRASTHSAGQQQASAVGCCVVRQAHGDPILWQFVRVGSAHDHVSLDLCIGDLQQHFYRNYEHLFFHVDIRTSDANLADDVPVSEADNHAVLRRVVLVLILDNETLTSEKVSLSL